MKQLSGSEFMMPDAVAAKRARAAVVLDGAGCRRPNYLEIPNSATLLRLLPWRPELNSLENVFGFWKSSKLANRRFDTAGE